MDVKQAQKNARLMGVLYGVIYAQEMEGEELTYEGVERVMLQHCTEDELLQVFKEVKRYASLIKMIDGTILK